MSLYLIQRNTTKSPEKEGKESKVPSVGMEQILTLSKIQKQNIRLPNEYKNIHIFRLERIKGSAGKILFFSFAPSIIRINATHDTGAKHFLSHHKPTTGPPRPTTLTPSFDRLTQLGSIIKPLVFGDPRFSCIHFNKHSKSLGLCQCVCIIVYIMIEKGNKRISTGLLWPIFVECINNRRKSFKAQTTSHQPFRRE